MFVDNGMIRHCRIYVQEMVLRVTQLAISIIVTLFTVIKYLVEIAIIQIEAQYLLS
jgi:hypothetical protein